MSTDATPTGTTLAELIAQQAVAVFREAWADYDQGRSYTQIEQVEAYLSDPASWEPIDQRAAQLAGDIEHELTPLIGWLRLGPACTTDDERRETIARLTRAIRVLSPEWTVSEEIRPTESAASSVALVAARREGAAKALRAAAAACPNLPHQNWLNHRADRIEAGEDPS